MLGFDPELVIVFDYPQEKNAELVDLIEQTKARNIPLIIVSFEQD